ncbi:hypothetical protein [Clostridium perfringens]|uniref:hypothetical protein n=1 Tax=Clostridium perfringens TaxID=1502 RepID=UPI0039EA9A8D
MKKYYIYNLKQAYFYIANGVIPIGTGFNKKTEKIYFVFDDRNSREVYDTWCKNNNNIKPN